MTSASSVPESSPIPSAEENEEIVAKPGRYYRWARYIVSTGLIFVVGAWFLWDGFVAWPRENAKVDELERMGLVSHIKEKKHGPLDIKLNRAIGLIGPPLGLALLIWTLYNSRGQYRLSGRTLYVPGHPPVPLEAIRQIDKTRWEKKGIAYIDYELPPEGDADPAAAAAAGEPATGRLKLDDFVYEQEKTDAILERIEQIVAPEEAETPGTPETADSRDEAVGGGGLVEERAVETETASDPANEAPAPTGETGAQ